MMAEIKLVTTNEECETIVQRIRTSEDPEDKVVGVDCEGVILSRYGRLTLLQLGWQNCVYLFDIKQNGQMLQRAGGLKDLLRDDGVLKVFHSCDKDSEALFYQFGVTMKNVFDIQVAHCLIKELKDPDNESMHWPRRERLNVICEAYGQATNTEKDLSFDFQSNLQLWAERPLTERKMRYAAMDVIPLIPVYNKQKELIVANGKMAYFKMLMDRRTDVSDFASQQSQIQSQTEKDAYIQTLKKRIVEKGSSRFIYLTGNEKQAIRFLRKNNLHTRMLSDLKEQQLASDADDINREYGKSPSTFSIRNSDWAAFNYFVKNSGNRSLQDLRKRIIISVYNRVKSEFERNEHVDTSDRVFILRVEYPADEHQRFKQFRLDFIAHFEGLVSSLLALGTNYEEKLGLMKAQNLNLMLLSNLDKSYLKNPAVIDFKYKYYGDSVRMRKK